MFYHLLKTIVMQMLSPHWILAGDWMRLDKLALFSHPRTIDVEETELSELLCFHILAFLWLIVRFAF